MTSVQESAAPHPSPRVLVAIPAYNESLTIESVVHGIHAAAPDFSVLLVNDGSTDDTEAVVRRLGVPTATHLCNLGYGRAVQTAVKFAERYQYDAVITFDADGQHRAEELQPLWNAFAAGGFDLLIGSRFVTTRAYHDAPPARRIGMRLFSTLLALLFGRRIYDTTSGLKVIGKSVFGHFISRPFVDFHAEAIAYLLAMGYRIGEHPITVEPRRHGESMYRFSSLFAYPLQVAFLILVGVVDVRLFQRGRLGP